MRLLDSASIDFYLKIGLDNLRGKRKIILRRKWSESSKFGVKIGYFSLIFPVRTSRCLNFLIPELSLEISTRIKLNVFSLEPFGLDRASKLDSLFFARSKPDLSRAKRKVPARSFAFPFLPVQLSLLDSRNKRLVHQGSPCPKQSTTEIRFPFVFARLLYSPPFLTLFSSLSSSTLFCSLILVVALFPFDTFSNSYLLSGRKNIGPREREREYRQTLPLVDRDFVNS